jgi:hypothetical protein
MSGRKSNRQPPITNRSFTVDEHELNNGKKQENDDQQHGRSASNSGTKTSPFF